MARTSNAAVRRVGAALLGLGAAVCAVLMRADRVVAGRLGSGVVWAAAVGVVAYGVWVTRRHRRSVRVFGLGALAITLAAGPAIGTFSVPIASRPASNTQYNSLTVAAPTGLSCSWTGGTSVRLDWTATASAWADGHQMRRKVDAGSYADYGSVIQPAATVTYTDTSATGHPSTAYRYQVRGTKNSWRSTDSGEVVSSSCGGLVSTIVMPVVTATVSDPQGLTFDSSGDLYIADTANHVIRKVTTSTGVITTVAGDGTAGTTDNVAATAGRLNAPEAVAVASNGDLYIADTTNNKIRKVTAATGIISTAAGTGTAGSTGDGAGATAARLNKPAGVLVGSDGVVWIADRTNNRIRKFTPGGNISLVLGNTGGGNVDTTCSPATACRIQFPESIAFDAAQANVYIADRGNHKVRKYNIAGNSLSTVAGTGTTGTTDNVAATSGQLASPEGVVVASNGDYYIADTGNHKIRKVTAATGNISTAAGTGTAGFTGPGYPALSSRLSSPRGVAVNAGDVMYFSDTLNDLVRQLTTNGNIVAVAGNQTGGYAGNGTAAASADIKLASGMATDASGNVYIADENDHRIRKWFANTGEVATIAGTGTAGSTGDGSSALLATINSPRGVDVASNGDVYIGEYTGNRIRKITAATGNISLYAGTGVACSVAPCGNGGAATSAQFNGPRDLELDASGNLYVVDSGTHTVRKIDTQGTPVITNYAGTLNSAGSTGDNGAATSATLSSPRGIGISASGDVYIADYSNHKIRKVDTQATPQITTVAGIASGAGNCSSPVSATTVGFWLTEDVVVVGNDFFFVNESLITCKVSGGTATKVIGDGTVADTGDGVPAAIARTGRPRGITYSSATGLFISTTDDGGTIGRIRKISVPL